jgi:hypothetical protein
VNEELLDFESDTKKFFHLLDEQFGECKVEEDHLFDRRIIQDPL